MIRWEKHESPGYFEDPLHGCLHPIATMLSYPDSVRFLYSLGNEIKAFKFGLDTICMVLAALGNPQLESQHVHIAGTNGKGSTCAMIESALRSAGRPTGLYTSPHLVEPTERIRIQGEMVTAEEFSKAFDVVHLAAEKLLAENIIENHPTYFETVTAMAFVLFRDKQAKEVVLETGLGGRLDATNIVTPRLTVITSIDYDHESWLGNSIEGITTEKAGILKPEVTAVISAQRPEAEAIIVARAKELNCKLIRAADYPFTCNSHIDGIEVTFEGQAYSCPLRGRHQGGNLITALLSLRELGIRDEHIRSGIANVQWPGRMERVASNPEIILDGAHNPAGARVLASHLREHYHDRKIWLIYGTMRDKSVAEIADTLFPLAQELILTAPDNPRSLDPQSLLEICGHPKARVTSNLSAALQIIEKEAAKEDSVFISGSLFLVGEARAIFFKERASC